VVLAAAAHPDDVEFMMAGTLARLGRAGYSLHYLNVANGSCGTATHSRDEIVAIRTEEARQAAAVLGAEFHAPLVDDLEIYYASALARRCGAIVREVEPDILLLQSPQDYMEDHTNASRLLVTAAFCRAMPNFVTDPPQRPISKPMAVYHALPWGLCDSLRQPVQAEFYVDVTELLPEKRRMLACHRSQKEWLDRSQGLDSYLLTMEDMCRQVGVRSRVFAAAEGWRRHSHLGFADPEFDPLTAALGQAVAWNPAYGARQTAT
jgi:LmbE family N-acetylglucosaminyl deacetylase